MRIALLTHRHSRKGAVVASALAARGIRPALIVCEQPQIAPATARLRALILERGPGALTDKLLSRLCGKPQAEQPQASASGLMRDAAGYAAQHGIVCLDLPDLVSAASLDRLRSEAIDLMIHAGAGICLLYTSPSPRDS